MLISQWFTIQNGKKHSKTINILFAGPKMAKGPPIEVIKFKHQKWFMRMFSRAPAFVYSCKCATHHTHENEKKKKTKKGIQTNNGKNGRHVKQIDGFPKHY